MGDIGAEVTAHNAVPGGVILLIKFFFDVSCNIFFDVELLQGYIGAINCILLHFFIHVGMFNHCFSLSCGHLSTQYNKIKLQNQHLNVFLHIFDSENASEKNYIKSEQYLIETNVIFNILRFMLTIQRERKNRSTYIQMKSAANMKQKDRHIQKLGGSIKASIDKLKRLRTEIQVENSLKRLATLMAQYEKQNNYYNELQISLAEIDEESEICNRIKQMNKDFIQTYDPEELRKKFDYMKAERTQHIKTQNRVQMNAFNEEQISGQLLASDKHAIRNQILQQQRQQLLEIQRMINQVIDIATKTSIMINAQGQKIQLSLQKMKKARMNLKDGRQLLAQANQYQQDTNKKYMAFCCITVLIVSIIVLIMYSSSKKSS